MTRRWRDADNLAHRLDRAADVIPTILDHLAEQRALIPPLPARGEGERQVGTHSDPTLRTVVALDGLERRRVDILDALASINVGVNLLERACAAALGTRAIPTERSADPTPTAPRCNAAGRDGAIEWGDATCTNVPSRGPLCERCAKAEYRWRRKHGLPPRRDGVFSQPGPEAEAS